MKYISTCILSLISFIAFAQIDINSQWTWVSGDSSINNKGVYGAQGIPAQFNRPSARNESVSWKDNQGNLWLFGGIGYDASGNNYLNDLWKYDPATNQWTWIRGDSAISIQGKSGIYGTQGSSGAINCPGPRAGANSWKDMTFGDMI
jgi:hypothetical protein